MHKALLLSGAWLFLISVIPQAFGQETEQEPSDTLLHYQIDDVIVTGTRTEKRIIDVPYSVERIDNSQFRFDRRVSVSDVLGSVPGLFMQSRYGNHDVRISIRGFGSRSNSGIRGVRILLDGIPESEPDGQTRIEAIDFNSIGSIEVVKGNSSSLYTNAPGGVINFINDINFAKSHVVQFNDFGSFGLRKNGLKVGIRTENYGFLTTYSYHQSKGFRSHSQDYWHILNSVVETTPGDDSFLRIYGYYVRGLIKLPGSLTLEQFDADPLQANSRDEGRDAKRISEKGRLGIQFSTFWGEGRSNQLELTGYGTIKYFERAAREYRIINRNGIGFSGRYIHRSQLFGHDNEFSVGSDMFSQYGPIENYDNPNGKKGDVLSLLTNEIIGNIGFYFQESFSIINDQLDVLFTGRYDKVVFDQVNQLFEAQNAVRRFEEFTPKGALNFKFTPSIALYTSYGVSFDSPAGNELDNYPISSMPTLLLNPDLQAQKSRNFEIGAKGNIIRAGSEFFRRSYIDVAFFNSIIEDEIVPFEIFGEVFFRNAAKTNRKGIELGITTEVIGGLKFKAAYTFSDFVYREYAAASIQADTTIRDFSGNIVPSVPKHNATLSISYEHSFNEQVTGFVKETYNHVSGMYADDANSGKTRGYNLLNTTAGVDVRFGGLNVLFSGGLNNLFDLLYVGFVNINSSSDEFYEAGEPRHFFASLKLGYTFE